MSETNTRDMDVNQLEKSISRKTKLIMMAHTLGIPYDLEKVLYLVKKHDLWLIEDSCDALGSRYDGKLVGEKKPNLWQKNRADSFRAIKI